MTPEEAKKSNKPFRVVHDCTTGKTTAVYLTKKEIDGRKVKRAAIDKENQKAMEIQAQADRRAAALDALLSAETATPGAPQAVKDWAAGR